ARECAPPRRCTPHTAPPPPPPTPPPQNPPPPERSFLPLRHAPCLQRTSKNFKLPRSLLRLQRKRRPLRRLRRFRWRSLPPKLLAPQPSPRRSPRQKLRRNRLSQPNPNSNWTKNTNSCSSRNHWFPLTIRSLRSDLLPRHQSSGLSRRTKPRHLLPTASNPTNSSRTSPRKPISPAWIPPPRLFQTQTRPPRPRPPQDRKLLHRHRLPRRPARSRKFSKSFAPNSAKWALRRKTSRPTTTSELLSARWAYSKKPSANFRKSPKPATAAALSATPCSAAPC